MAQFKLVRDVAKDYGVDKTTVYKWLKTYNIKKDIIHRKETGFKREYVLDAEGLGQLEVALVNKGYMI
jgi:transposase